MVIHLVRLQNLLKNQQFLPIDTHTYVCVSGVKLYQKNLRTHLMNDPLSYTLLLHVLANMITFNTASVVCK